MRWTETGALPLNVQRLDSEVSEPSLAAHPLPCQLSGVGRGGYPSDRAVFVDRAGSVWPRRKPSRKASCQPATGREDRRVAWVGFMGGQRRRKEPPAEELRAGFSRHGRRLTPTTNICSKCNERVGSIQTQPRGRQRRALFR